MSLLYGHLRAEEVFFLLLWPYGHASSSVEYGHGLAWMIRTDTWCPELGRVDFFFHPEGFGPEFPFMPLWTRLSLFSSSEFFSFICLITNGMVWQKTYKRDTLIWAWEDGGGMGEGGGGLCEGFHNGFYLETTSEELRQVSWDEYSSRCCQWFMAWTPWTMSIGHTSEMHTRVFQ